MRISAFESFKSAPSILEGFVDFAFEASVIAARAADGAFAAYDPPENLHEHHILRRSTVPGAADGSANATRRKPIAKKIADALDYVGVFCVELFVAKDGALLVNEIAPRVHNSGHWTIEACVTSASSSSISAPSPAGRWVDPARHSDAVMENIIGEEAANWKTLAAMAARCISTENPKSAPAGRWATSPD